MFPFLFLIDSDQERQELLEKMFRRYSRMMLRAAAAQGISPEDAEDVVADIFLYIMRRAMDKFSDMEEEKLKATLLVAAKNRAINARERKKREVPIEVYYIQQQKMLAEDPTDEQLMRVIRSHETRAELETAIKALDDTLSETLYLHLICGLSGKKISELTDTDVSTVYKRISRGKLKLMEQLEEGGQQE